MRLKKRTATIFTKALPAILWLAVFLAASCASSEPGLTVRGIVKDEPNSDSKGGTRLCSGWIFFGFQKGDTMLCPPFFHPLIRCPECAARTNPSFRFSSKRKFFRRGYRIESWPRRNFGNRNRTSDREGN